MLNAACNEDSGKNDQYVVGKSTESAKTATITKEFYGRYCGNQPTYNLKNQNGEEIIINGNYVSVPGCDYKFVLKPGNLVDFYLINKEDNYETTTEYYGEYQILQNASQHIELECKFSGSESSPTYIIKIDKKSKEALCTGNNEPELILKKI